MIRIDAPALENVEGATREERPSVSFVTLGCKVNQTESEALGQLFRNNGYEIVNSSAEADVVVINTCTVTNTGDSKSRQVIRKMVKKHPEAFVAVMGCYAQTAPGEVLNIEGVDLVIGTQDRARILELIQKAKVQKQPLSTVHEISEAREFEELPQLEGESRTRATLKIQEGCNQFCTYCIIPYARGPVRSRQPEKALAEAEKLVQAGYKEIVLTGIHTGSYGEDLVEGWNLARLIQELTGIVGLKRLRLSSVEPREFTPELLGVIENNPLVCPHLHIPLQSGSDATLSRMKRPYTVKDYRELIGQLQTRVPGIAITTDIIVGFPGETEEDFQNSLECIRSCGFAGVHVFPYSKRQGTPAAAYPDQIANKLKEERVKTMLEVARQSQAAYIRGFLGQPLEVLIERVDGGGYATGYSRNYIQVHLPPRAEKPWQNGELTECLLEEKFLNKPI